jgi:iron complex outermembrane receptor protein
MCIAAAAVQVAAAAAQDERLAGLSLEELGRLEVTSVSRSAELLSAAPAAVYIITQDEIRRSGATTLLDALRLAPNLRLHQLGAGSHVASTRGFGGNQEAQNFSNKLLLLIDGRSVYSPLFSGIYLDVQDVVLADIARIEVISGPGATLWGANAMNGVINVITRPAWLSKGASVTLTGGNDRQHVAARYGDELGKEGAYRVYMKALRSDAMEASKGVSAGDGWQRGQVGFRSDFTRANGEATLQGDVLKAQFERPGADEERVTGANLLGRWRRQGNDSQLQVQAWIDHVQRETRLQEGQRLNSYELELQQELQAGPRHDIVWGAGARIHRYRIYNAPSLQFEPVSRTLSLWNLFAQDTLSLGPQLKLTLGMKLEHNSFSGWEPQPDVRLAWQASGTTMAWMAGSRAIRSPTPFDTDVVEFLGDTRFLEGNPDFRAEEVFAYETGFRYSAAPSFWLSMAAFYNRYDDLRTVEFGSAPGGIPLTWGNEMEGDTHGINAWATWQVTDWWRLSPGLQLLRKDLRLKPGSTSPLGTSQAGNDPRTLASLTSAFDLGGGHSLNIAFRHVGELPDPALGSHTDLSVRYAARLNDTLELSVRGTNLLEARHREYPASAGVLVGRAVMAEARWRW